MRAFLEAVSVFPLGGTVRLSDGRCGRVVEARRGRPAEPRVELWDPLAGRFTGQVVDLAAGPPGGEDPARPAPDAAADAAPRPDAGPGRPHVVAADEPLPLAFSRAA